MNKILYITANPKHVKDSYSLQVGEQFIKEYQNQNPDDEIITVDLFNTDVPFIDSDVFNAWNKLGQGIAFTDLSATEQSKVSAMGENLETFMNADKYVFVVPLWNFGLPPVVKAYIDNLAIAGKTFKYTEQGPVGLLKNKKALIIESSGGVYSNIENNPYEHGYNHLKVVLPFMGINDVEAIFVEGVNLSPEAGKEGLQKGFASAETISKTF